MVYVRRAGEDASGVPGIGIILPGANMLLIGGPEIAWCPALSNFGHRVGDLARRKAVDIEIVGIEDAFDGGHGGAVLDDDIGGGFRTPRLRDQNRQPAKKPSNHGSNAHIGTYGFYRER